MTRLNAPHTHTPTYLFHFFTSSTRYGKMYSKIVLEIWLHLNKMWCKTRHKCTQSNWHKGREREWELARTYRWFSNHQRCSSWHHHTYRYNKCTSTHQHTKTLKLGKDSQVPWQFQVYWNTVFCSFCFVWYFTACVVHLCFKKENYVMWCHPAKNNLWNLCPA